jgi:hypothetical protein
MVKIKLTAKEKRKCKRIEKKLTVRFCKETDSFGNIFCPHCYVLILLSPGFAAETGPKVRGLQTCDICKKNFVVTEDIVKVVVERKERFNGILQKLRTIPYDNIDVIEVGIDRNCDINEVALLCKHFQCSIADLAGRVKSQILYKKPFQVDNNI